MYRAALALMTGDLDATLTHAREALRLAPPEGALVRAGAGALAGLAAWTTGDLTDAHAAYTESIAGLTSIGYLADVLGCSITLADISRTQGELGAALRTCRHALDLAATAPGGPLRGSADMHVALAEVLLERDDLAGATEQLTEAERLGEYNGLPQNPYRQRLVAARLREIEGDLDGALDLLDEAERVYNGDYSPNVRPVPAVRARLRLRRGELGHVEQWARERGLSADDELSYLLEFEHVTLARLLLARHASGADEASLRQATDLLDRLREAAEEGGRLGTVLELHVLSALARHAEGETASAVAELRRAVHLGRAEGYVRVFADAGRPVAVLLGELAKDGPPDLRRHVQRLLAATSPAEASGVPRQGGVLEPLSARELDVLRLFATELDGPDIARRLHVSLNTLRTHSRNIFRKLEVNSRRGAVRQAVALDLLPRQRA
jgi:LuxR family maltose regulon positive regulatory protein